MVYAKLAPLAVLILLLSSSTIPMKKVEAACGGACTVFDRNPCGGGSCVCALVTIYTGICANRGSKAYLKMVEEHPNICESHDDCKKKGSGSFCASYPNPPIEHGWCFASNSMAEEYFKSASKYIYTNDFLKMPTTAEY